MEVELPNKDWLDDGQVFHKNSQESNSSQQSETSGTSRAGTLLENVTDQNGPNFQNQNDNEARIVIRTKVNNFYKPRLWTT